MEEIKLSSADREAFRTMVAAVPEEIMGLLDHGCSGCEVTHFAEAVLRVSGYDRAALPGLLAAQVRRAYS